MIQTVEILFSGRVQNVGFRSCVRNAGLNLGLCGEVENLPDGKVRALVTGEDVIIEKFLSMTYSCPRAIIRDVKCAGYVLTEFTDFTIKRD
ncbi:MAG TPA: acylphosphatase [Methanocorpusculum sp.]|jgi:acylphosphatase|nr:acylphosphatase [Methanocorpusculum sp.]MDD2470612.1 acylphosphatase [Methanocorpusculum sp.]MDD3256694.1 acylphosphatase [Methanocorpusculum sp.]MDD4132501.1 acylphosphatase [Methanocorpusculum sp.]HKM41887.1 acylphosphatase [Methanocorpusculum sp.]